MLESMDLFNVIMRFDTHTMLGVLFWSNVFLAAIVFTFETTIKTTQDKEYIHKAALTRIIYAAAYLFLWLWELLPGAVSFCLGYSILFFCFYLDACLMMSFLSVAEKRRQIVLKAVLVAGIVSFNLLEVFFSDETLRALVVSCITMAIYCIPTISFITRKINSRFKRVIGGFYILFLVSLFPRIVIPIVEMFDSSGVTHDIAIAHSGFYLILVIITICGILSTLLFIKERSDVMLENMALYDQLTQIPNRHGFFLSANLLFLKCQRERHEISLLITDIDYFKKVNDNYGHDFGDIVLRRFAVVIKESIRQYDLICRYGGEEFLMMLQCDKPDTAENLAQRIMERLKSEHFDEYPDFRFTISVGISTSIPNEDESLDTYIKNADAALYEAKNSGRNKICFCGAAKNVL